MNKFQRGEFIAWDGEGANINGEHQYILLANSAGDYISNPAGLSTLDCLTMLADTGARYPHAIHCCFGASYDVNMMLRDVPRSIVAQVWRAHARRYPAFWNFKLHYRARKEFTVIRGKQRVTLWDVFGFYQAPFVEAIRKNLGEDYAELPAIEAGKARRSQFAPDELPEIIAYTQAELRALVALMQKLRADLMAAGLEVSRWDGAGAVAAALLKKFGVKRYMEDSPDAVQHAAASAYSGGRIEILSYGTYRGVVRHGDIQSAYPYACTLLPVLRDGNWMHTTDGKRGQFSLSYVRWNLDAQPAPQLYPFFYREVDGNICYPASGQGWHWEPEIKAAEDARQAGYIRGTIEVLETWNFEPSSNAKPFAWLNYLYEQRKKWKRSGNGAEKAAKLGMNSVYGKMAQRIGAIPGAKPTYHQLEWAGYVTAWTRAKLYATAAPIREHVLMLATDGIFAAVPLPVRTGESLGDWETDEREGMLIVQAGVYFSWPDPDENFFCRGFDKVAYDDDGNRIRTLDHKLITSAYKRHRRSIDATMTRFVTMGSALAGMKSWATWRQWITKPKRLSLDTDGTKRAEIDCGGTSPWKRYPPHLTLVPTNAKLNVSNGYPSTPYDVPWLKKMTARQLDEIEAMEHEDTAI